MKRPPTHCEADETPNEATKPKKRRVRTEEQRLAHNAAQRERYSRQKLIPGWSRAQADRVAARRASTPKVKLTPVQLERKRETDRAASRRFREKKKAAKLREQRVDVGVQTSLPFPENGDLPASDTATPPEGYRPKRPDLDLTSNADVDSTHSSDQSAGDCPEEGYSPNRPDLDLTSNADVDSIHTSDQSNRDCPEEGSRPNRLDVDLTSTADVDSTHSFDQSAGDGPLEGSLPNPIDLTSNADLDGTDSSDDGSLLGRNADLKYLDDTATPKEGHSEEELTPPAYFHRYCDELTNYNDESESWRMYLLYNGSKLGITPPLFGTATFKTYRSPSWEDITEGAAKPSVPRAALPRSREVIPRTSIILTLTKLLRELSVDSFKDKNTFGGKVDIWYVRMLPTKFVLARRLRTLKAALREHRV